MLYLIGMGIHDPRDMSVKGLEIAKRCEELFYERYTSPVSVEGLRELLGKEVKELKRKDVEESNLLIEKAKEKDVAFLVPGDPLVATTHQELVLRARKKGIKVKIIHSSSIVSAVCETGLHIYKFGRVTSIPKTREDFFPTSPYHILRENLERGLHTLFLIDPEISLEEAVGYLFEAEKKEKRGVVSEETKGVSLSLGEEPEIVYGKLRDLKGKGKPQSLIIPGELHFTEEEFLRWWEHGEEEKG